MEKSAKSERKNGNGAQRNVLIFQNNALTLLKLSVGLDHMYTKEHIFFLSSPVMSLLNKTTFKSFITKGETMQQTL